ncbi:hypothetical protein B0I72DRAFT_42579 [Yarrowia lipolytica]|uniref:YALI0C09966p n=2 Tax=Yarrowia lipolytica TaxID=4952 RepID=Q6CCE9_YARLI|nr:YALI0C09966p [Yarrowia lipolytica CLIB122]AOW02610.1 hypothetical protein YALI1_C13879g [Yarrowia lipolytica]KAB8280063.1 hypothetical protein BKA91DRAFT_49718 [Yarrowia lipolytica]KAE8169570.1 hypothetical protein BKA90DRAFT_118153 [Yarrowia lipolytica]RDW27264.1 hypothetical protein B0I71DRAFT_115682 [Yarrowia lipolytica]RDW31851.1 hypothetical protein B0I72DRAFT_42579 [Yarrowia lipolytica]|eukprot:XP_501663.1 YALI0C09966p [Yarrowia lipolytica CLIB122]
MAPVARSVSTRRNQESESAFSLQLIPTKTCPSRYLRGPRSTCLRRHKRVAQPAVLSKPQGADNFTASPYSPSDTSSTANREWTTLLQTLSRDDECNGTTGTTTRGRSCTRSTPTPRPSMRST